MNRPPGISTSPVAGATGRYAPPAAAPTASRDRQRRRRAPWSGPVPAPTARRSAAVVRSRSSSPLHSPARPVPPSGRPAGPPVGRSGRSIRRAAARRTSAPPGVPGVRSVVSQACMRADTQPVSRPAWRRELANRASSARPSACRARQRAGSWPGIAGVEAHLDSGGGAHHGHATGPVREEAAAIAS